MKKLKFQACLDSVSEGVPFRFCSNVVEIEVEGVAARKSIPIHFAQKCNDERCCCDMSAAVMILLLTCMF